MNKYESMAELVTRYYQMGAISSGDYDAMMDDITTELLNEYDY